jgi:hypothetical protein
MPLLLGKLSYKGTDLQTLKVYFDIASGFWEPAEVRGQDDIIPGLSGRFRRNRVKDRRIIELRGWIRGVGGTVLERQQDWGATTAAVMALMDPTGAAGTLQVTNPYMGLTSGTKTISAYPLNLIGGEVDNSLSFQRWSIELEAVGTPPDWA